MASVDAGELKGPFKIEGKYEDLRVSARYVIEQPDKHRLIDPSYFNNSQSFYSKKCPIPSLMDTLAFITYAGYGKSTDTPYVSYSKKAFSRPGKRQRSSQPDNVNQNRDDFPPDAKRKKFEVSQKS